MLNLAVLGCVYGLCVLYWVRRVTLADQGGPAENYSGPAIILAGVFTAFVLHIGVSLFVWVFSRGIGGRTGFLPVYLNLAVAAIALWPAAPAAAAYQAGVSGWILGAYTTAAWIYGLTVGYVAAQRASGLSHYRMVIMVVATAIYAGCFLYLWT